MTTRDDRPSDRRLSAVWLTAGLLLLGGPGLAHAVEVQADFNGDGFADLAIGVPGEDIGSVASAGAVNVIYGRDTNGLSALINSGTRTCRGLTTWPSPMTDSAWSSRPATSTAMRSRTSLSA